MNSYLLSYVSDTEVDGIFRSYALSQNKVLPSSASLVRYDDCSAVCCALLQSYQNAHLNLSTEPLGAMANQVPHNILQNIPEPHGPQLRIRITHLSIPRTRLPLRQLKLLILPDMDQTKHKRQRRD